ncbi:patatin-like phospholipase family protein [Neolewinella antarctica]|uniref:NTE family protein n=1 Tax=Neolewinella antarctica TaxID=442734 RepID=A0ABX0XCN3_9BACT|nr:patatin-like phospholipase family protein [Neolewinella antarctica]NJC26952.1 NTE family protein [Neolewinella antarctica]
MANNIKIGLVLSGGGFRGIVHAGVIRGLEEMDIKPTHVAGASIGSVVGGLYAAGVDANRIRDVITNIHLFTRHNLAFSWSGLLDADKIEEPLLPYFPDDRFSALKKKLYISRTNLETGRAEIVSSGSVLDAIKCSAALPMLFAPVKCNGQVYVDGGLTDNFPVQTLRAECDVVIGVSANPALFCDRKELQSLFALMNQILEIGISQATAVKYDQCDVMIVPKGLDAYSLLDVEHAKALFDLGYETIMAQREELDLALVKNSTVKTPSHFTNSEAALQL